MGRAEIQSVSLDWLYRDGVDCLCFSAIERSSSIQFVHSNVGVFGVCATLSEFPNHADVRDSGTCLLGRALELDCDWIHDVVRALMGISVHGTRSGRELLHLLWSGHLDECSVKRRPNASTVFASSVRATDFASLLTLRTLGRRQSRYGFSVLLEVLGHSLLLLAAHSRSSASRVARR